MTRAAMDNDTMVEVTPDEDYTPAERAFLDSLGGYQKVFNAIADGTSVYAEGVGINITVKGFVKSLARHQSGRTGAGEALPKWVYDIQWGPEGQQDYAHVYDLGGNLIAVMKTHDAARIAKHRGCDQ